MFNFASGVSVPFPEKIKEGYQKFDNYLKCNISFEKLDPLLKDFYHNLDEPVFLALHIPLNRKEEERLKSEGQEGIHEEILYLDGCKTEQIDKVFKKYGELLLNDGMSKIAVASHSTEDEIFIAKYKISYIYSKELDKYLELMERYSIAETQSLVTAWDTFSCEHPGRCSRISINGIDIYNIMEELKTQGMYRAKIIESGKGKLMPN